MPVWMMVVEAMAKVILVLLVFLSIWSIKIILDRKKYFQSIDGLVDRFWKGSDASNMKSSDALIRGHETLVTQIKPELTKGLPVLGSLGSTAPFIGLFGTVLGIINAFGDLSMNSQNTNKVMFALAEALILTAVGLAVAIPAVIAFNYFKRKVGLVYDGLYVKRNQELDRL